MMAKDVFYSTSIALIAQGHGFLAGLFDWFGDICTVLSIGSAAIAIFVPGLSLIAQIFTIRTLEAFIALGIGSIIGTVIGSSIGTDINKSLLKKPSLVRKDK